MPIGCSYFVGKAAAAHAAHAFQYLRSILHHLTVFTQNLEQTLLLVAISHQMLAYASCQLATFVL